MGRIVFKPLNRHGFVHHVIPILAFVVLFGVVGAYFLLRSQAATPTYWFESTANGSYCISNNGGAAQARSCSSSGSSATLTSSGSYNGAPVDFISINSRCMDESNGTVRFTNSACNSSDEAWVLTGSNIESLTDTRLHNKPYCVGYSSLNGTITVKPCFTSGVNQGWYKAQAPGSVSSGGGGTPKFVVNLNGQAACYNNLYTTANVKTGSNCVAALQTMLNYMHAHYSGSTVTVDGYYGSNTAAQVSKYQAYQKRTASYVSVDGQFGKQTWQFMCWSGRNNHFNTTRAFLYAECPHVAPPPGKKNP